MCELLNVQCLHRLHYTHCICNIHKPIVDSGLWNEITKDRVPISGVQEGRYSLCRIIRIKAGKM